MKKIGLILTLLSTIFAPQEVLAATATQDLQVGHYYRIRSSVTTDKVGGVVQKHYMCLVYDNAASQYEVKILRQSDIVSAPGSIFKITGLTSSKINLETQGQDVWSSIKGSSLIDEHGRNWTWTADLLNIFFDPIKYAAVKNSDGFHLSAAVRGSNSGNIATEAYFQDETLSYRNSSYVDHEDYHEPVGMSAEPSTIWYFEEVNEANIDDTYLGLPCAVSKESVTVSDMVTNTVDGVTYYYSTMRAPFPLQFVTKRNGANEQSKLTPGDLFFVKSDGSLVNIEFNPSGTMSKTYVIPANKPFVIRTTTNNPADYKFQPSLGSGNVTNTNVNALQSASTYFVRNASGNGVSGKRMLSIVDGEAKFHNRVGSEINLSYYDGNRAYFSKDSDPIPVIEEKTLSELIHGNYDSGTQYILSNDLYVGYVTDGKVVYAHDAGVDAEYEVNMPAGANEYKGFAHDDYTQYNWVALDVDVATETAKYGTENTIIPGGTLIGAILDDKNNPEFQVYTGPASELSTRTTDASLTHVNQYIAANFATDANGMLTATAGNNKGTSYWFMPPVGSEVVKVTWAVIVFEKDSDGKYTGNAYAYIPKNVNGANGNGFQGKIKLDVSMFSNGGTQWPSNEDEVEQWNGKVYEFMAVAIKNSSASGAPRRVNASDVIEGDENQPTSRFTLSVLELTGTNGGVVTGIDAVAAGKVVRDVKFYNLQGVAKAEPWQGVNIIVRTFDDGTRDSKKVVF